MTATEAKEVYKRLKDHPSNYCWYCGVHITGEADETADNKRTVEHVYPKSKGGKDVKNTVSCCRKCNQLKRDLTLDEFRWMLGGGLFWGEVFHTKHVSSTPLRASNAKAFAYWLFLQKSHEPDYWFDKCKAASVLRDGTVFNVEDRFLSKEENRKKNPYNDFRRLIRILEKKTPPDVYGELAPVLGEIYGHINRRYFWKKWWDRLCGKFNLEEE